MSLFGRRERREIRELNADVDCLRDQRDEGCGERDTAVFNRHQISEQYTDVCTVNTCLTEDLAAAAARIAEYGIRRTVPEVLEEHDVHRKVLADALGEQKRHLNWGQLIAEVGQLNGAAQAWMADHAAEKQRADHLQRRLDQALGLDARPVLDGRHWQDTRQDKPAVKEPS